MSAVFFLALGVRVLYLLQIRGTPLTEVLLIDSETYDRMARAILSGTNRGEGIYAMNPLYPYVLAGVYALAGTGIGAVLLLQGVLDAASVALVAAIGMRLFGRLAGWAAGLAAAFYGPMIFYSGALLTPTVISFLIVAALGAFLLPRKRPGAGATAGAGILVGLAALGRGTNALLVPGMLPLFLTQAPRRSSGWSRWGIFAAAAGLVVGGMTLRNALVEGRFVPIAANYAAFYIGHNPKATGLYAMPDFVTSARYEGEVLGAREEISSRVGRELSLAETSGFLFREGLRYALTHPGRELRLASVKLYYALNRTESPTNLNYAFARDFSPLLRFLPLQFGLIAPWGAAGIVLSGRRWRELLPLYAVLLVTLGTCVAFFVSAEYRMPAVPVLLIFGGHAVSAVIAAGRDRFGRGRTSGGGRTRRAGSPGGRRILLAAGLFAATAAAGNLETSRLRFQSLKRVDYLNFGILYRERGDLSTARRMLETALRIDPRYAPAYAALAVVADREGNEVEALRLDREARRYRPAGESPEIAGLDSEATADSLLALVGLYRSGRYRDALAGFEALLTRAGNGNPPLTASLLNNIGLCRYKLGDLDGAAAVYAEILAADSTYVKAYTNLGLVLEAQGKREDARTRFRRALALDPGNRTAARELGRLDEGP